VVRDIISIISWLEPPYEENIFL